MRGRPLVIGVCLLLTAAACGGESDPDEAHGAPAAEQIVAETGVHNRLLEGHIEIEVSGAIETTFSGTTPINVLTNVSEETPEEFWSLTVGILPTHRLESENGFTIRPAFDIVGYDGDGEYSIEPFRAGGLTEADVERLRRGESITSAQGPARDAITFLVAEADQQPTNFNTPGESCTVRVGDAGLNGVIDCPAASNGEDVIDFRWEWTADREKELDFPEPEAAGGDDNTRADTGDRDVATTTTTAPSGAGTSSGGSVDDAPFPLDVDVAPSDCASVGTLVTVDVATVPDAFITMIVGYSDGQAHGNAVTGVTNGNGGYLWAFAVPATAPRGDTTLLVNVTRTDNSEAHGEAIAIFELRATC